MIAWIGPMPLERVHIVLARDPAPMRRTGGCSDIDREAIQSRTQRAKGSFFDAIQPDPPASHPEIHFDLVHGISISRHLDEEMQDK